MVVRLDHPAHRRGAVHVDGHRAHLALHVGRKPLRARISAFDIAPEEDFLRLAPDDELAPDDVGEVLLGHRLPAHAYRRDGQLAEVGLREHRAGRDVVVEREDVDRAVFLDEPRLFGLDLVLLDGEVGARENGGDEAADERDYEDDLPFHQKSPFTFPVSTSTSMRR